MEISYFYKLIPPPKKNIKIVILEQRNRESDLATSSKSEELLVRFLGGIGSLLLPQNIQLSSETDQISHVMGIVELPSG